VNPNSGKLKLSIGYWQTRRRQGGALGVSEELALAKDLAPVVNEVVGRGQDKREIGLTALEKGSRAYIHTINLPGARGNKV
jgi:hypothetical protein